MRRLLSSLSVMLLAGTFVSVVAPVPAYAQQSLSLYLGGFAPHGEDGRIDGDVLFNDLSFFLFRLNDFTGVTGGGEWLIALNDRAEVGLGVGLYSKTVPSTYASLVKDNGAEIRQRLKLRTVPLAASFRVLPFGRKAAVQPYIGAGVNIISWRYTETGDFVDFDGFVFHDRFEGSGTSTGPLILGGVRVPVGHVDIGAEIRHQSGEGKISPLDFAGGTTVDLGGFSYLATFNIRF